MFGVHFNQLIGLDTEFGPFSSELLFSNGEYGVALFFILSGFVISLPFWRAQNNQYPLPALKPYIQRRMVRIIPAYYISLLLTLLITGLWRLPNSETDIALHLLLLHNLTEFTVLSINPPYWSLGVEVQFYLLLPILFMLISGFTSKIKILVLILLAFFSYWFFGYMSSQLTYVIQWPLDSALVWIRPFGAVITYSLIAHLPHFILGIICAFLYLKLIESTLIQRQWFKPIVEVIFWITAITLSLILTTELTQHLQIPYGRYGLPTIPLLLAVLVLTTPFTTFTLRLLESRFIYNLGVLSYGIYIYHHTILMHIYQWMYSKGNTPEDAPITFASITLFLTLSIAWSSWILIERPAINWLKRVIKKPCMETMQGIKKQK